MSLVKLNNNAVKNVTIFGSASGGSITFIKKLTASSSSTLSFVDGASSVVLDNTYKEYIFTFKNIHPGTAETSLNFNMSTDSGSNYNVTKTTTFFRANHREDDGGTPGFGYRTEDDLAQSTSFQRLSSVGGAGNDEAISGYLHLFNPSSTTFVKHFLGQTNTYMINQDHTNHSLFAGYGNTTSAVDAIQFKMNSGNIDAGDIVLYGIN
jgi:3-oxoacyl-[acyl-carrier-protein] synthase III